MCSAIQALEHGSTISQATLMHAGQDARVLCAMHALQEEVKKPRPYTLSIQM